MNLNTRLFLKINSTVGRSALLDHIGHFGAKFFIFFMALGYAALSYLAAGGNMLRLQGYLLVALFAWLAGWCVNLLLASIVREPRPHTTHPASKLLFKPLATRWKSFPSDHALSAWLIFFIACFLGLPGAWIFLPLAIWVCWGRVYAGVHYPFDVFAGFVVALAVATVFKLYVI